MIVIERCEMHGTALLDDRRAARTQVEITLARVVNAHLLRCDVECGVAAVAHEN